MGIPRFYKWLKGKYPLIRMDLTDTDKQLPIFDNFYIDFNALVYQCIRESNCFLRNKIKPLTIDQIYSRVYDYLLELINTINPQKVLYLAFDGVAPRAKINQSRDRRFKSAKEDEEFEKILQKIGVQNNQIFQQNSISPGTKFLTELGEYLKARIMQQVKNGWRHLKVFFSDCTVPGEGQHKIMNFFRYSKSIQLFHEKTTYCVYSPDADVILLTLSLGIQNICLIKQDTMGPMGPNWTATTVYRKAEPKKFQLVMINILREYFQKQYDDVLKVVPGSNIQKIIDDMILLMAFVGNDFLPIQFCFTLKDNHVDNLFYSYKVYLKQHKQFINDRGTINWQKVYKLLQIGKKFQAKMIQEKINNHKSRRQNKLLMEDQKKGRQSAEQDDDTDIQNFQVQNQSIVKGRQKYYNSRFGIGDLQGSNLFKNIIIKYIQGLQFYCKYYFQGLPSWTWYYPYHYTPMLTDVYQYLKNHKVQVKFENDAPFDPILALMFMMPLKCVELLPKPIQNVMLDPNNILRKPIDYFPKDFQLDKFQSLRYSKRAIIQFLQEADVRKLYESVKPAAYTVQQRKRNEKKNTILFYLITDKNGEKVSGTQISQNQSTQKQLKLLFPPTKQISNKLRFPSLSIWGDFVLNQQGRIITKNKYKYQGNPGQLVYFNNFLGIISDTDKCSQDLRSTIDSQYDKNGISAKVQNIYVIKRVKFIRQVNRFYLTPTKKEVIVPDFALFKPPTYEFIHKTEMKPSNQLYSKGQRVVVLSQKYFGHQGYIQQVEKNNAKVRLFQPPIISSGKIQELEQDFYTVDYALDQLNIHYETLLAIMDQIIILPQFNKKEPALQSVPSALNFSLNLIDSKIGLIIPRHIRCQMQNQNTRKPNQIFRKMQISKTCMKMLEEYVEQFSWLVDHLEHLVSGKSFAFKKALYARQIFATQKQPNIKMYQEFIKLYKFKNQGSFYSIYSKIASQIPNFIKQNRVNELVSLPYQQFISKNQAKLAPPSLKSQPQYHNIGDRIILLSTLQTGYISGIDDYIIHVRIGRQAKHYRVNFWQIFNQKWTSFLSKEQGQSWNLQVSYFSPTYWKKAIDVEAKHQEAQQESD